MLKKCIVVSTHLMNVCCKLHKNPNRKWHLKQSFIHVKQVVNIDFLSYLCKAKLFSHFYATLLFLAEFLFFKTDLIHPFQLTFAFSLLYFQIHVCITFMYTFTALQNNRNYICCCDLLHILSATHI